jgi:hypothetical protein
VFSQNHFDIATTAEKFGGFPKPEEGVSIYSPSSECCIYGRFSGGIMTWYDEPKPGHSGSPIFDQNDKLCGIYGRMAVHVL